MELSAGKTVTFNSLERKSSEKIYNPVGSYRTNFTVPENWDEKAIILRFGSISGYARVFVNGKEAGMTKASKTPAEFDITDLLQVGGKPTCSAGF